MFFDFRSTDSRPALKRFIGLGLATLSLLCLPLYAETPPQFTGAYPMVQLPSSTDTVPLTVLVPREQGFLFEAVPVNAPGAEPSQNAKGIKAQVILASDHPEPKKLLEKVLRVTFTGLAADTWYAIRMYEVKFGKRTGPPVDVRYAKTLNGSAKKLRFVLGSCMSDELRYKTTADQIWTRVWNSNPDLIVLTGDLVYVDAFDYVKRTDVTNSVVWQRFYNTFKTLPLYRATTLIPLFATPDDHDAGINDAHSKTAVLPEAMRAFRAFYVGPDLPGVHESNPDEARGIYRVFYAGGQKIFLLDNRTARLQGEGSEAARYGHLSKKQEDWLIEKLGEDSRPAYLFAGDQWTAPGIADKAGRIINESLAASHPVQFTKILERIWETGTTVIFGAGDIHFSEITLMGPQFDGTPDYAPYETVELTASPMHSFIFAPKKGEPVLWKRNTRISPERKEASFMQIDSEPSQETGLNVRAAIYGIEAHPYSSYSFHADAVSEHLPVLGRRKFRHRGFEAINGKVAVAFFDKDATLAETNDGSRVANRTDQIVIMKNRSAKLAELADQGYLNAIVSNQGGVAAGFMKVEQADEIVRHTADLIEAEDARALVHYYDFSEHGSGDLMHKPDTGMLIRLQIELASLGLEIDWDRSFFVGDAHEKAGIDQDGDGIPGTDFSDSDRVCAELIAQQKRSKFRFHYAPRFFTP